MTEKQHDPVPAADPMTDATNDTFAAEQLDPATTAQEPAETAHLPAPTEEKKPRKQPKSQAPATKVKGSFVGGTWIALIAGALLLILLLVFILQNQQPAELTLFNWQFTFPTGVGLLLAAIAGALIMALVGGVRMIQLRHQIKKTQKLQGDKR